MQTDQQTLFHIAMIASLAVVFSNIFGLWRWLKWKLKWSHLKPFDCEKCMGWWFGLLYFYPGKHTFVCYDYKNILLWLGYGAACSVTAILLLKLVKQRATPHKS